MELYEEPAPKRRKTAENVDNMETTVMMDWAMNKGARIGNLKCVSSKETDEFQVFFSIYVYGQTIERLLLIFLYSVGPMHCSWKDYKRG